MAVYRVGADVLDAASDDAIDAISDMGALSSLVLDLAQLNSFGRIGIRTNNMGSDIDPIYEHDTDMASMPASEPIVGKCEIEIDLKKPRGPQSDWVPSIPF
jgi:hypothetical protein